MSVRLLLIGSFALREGGREIVVSPSIQRLVAFLALHQRALTRTYVAAALWLDVTEDRSSASLRSALWRLRCSGHAIVESDGGRVRLARHVDVDAHDMVARARRLLDGSAEHAETYLDDGYLSADLLPDWYDDWVMIERERLRQLRMHALEALCDQLRAAGRYGQAIEAGLAAVRCEPLRESAHRSLVRVHLDEGNLGEALRQYKVFRDLLRQELSLEPSPQIAGLVAGLTPE